MAEYRDAADAVARHQAYPDLSPDLVNHDFQRRRVRASLRFVRPGETLLEVGCNAGYVVDYCPQAAEIHGVDASAALAAIARGRLTSVQIARAEALPFADRAFDVVHVGGVLEQVYDPAAVVREAARVARRLVCGNTTHEAGTWGKHRTPFHAWQSYSWSQAELLALLNAVGTVEALGTIDIGTAPQCWYFALRPNATEAPA